MSSFPFLNSAGDGTQQMLGKCSTTELHCQIFSSDKHTGQIELELEAKIRRIVV
jgi:hypothetical protein